jgi:hypothetical protein
MRIVVTVAAAQMKGVFSPHCGDNRTHLWHTEHKGPMSQNFGRSFCSVSISYLLRVIPYSSLLATPAHAVDG